MHICTREDKVILVTGGKFLVFADGKKYEAGTGANIFIPRGTLHNFKNTRTQTGKILVTFTLGGHENFLKDLSRPIRVYGNNISLMNDVAKKYDVVLV